MKNPDTAPKCGKDIIAYFGEALRPAMVYFCQRYKAWSFSNSASFCRSDFEGWADVPNAKTDKP